MKTLLLISLIFISNLVIGNDLQYVWNLEGTTIKVGPSKHTQTIKNLKLGDSVQIAPFNRDQNTVHSSLGNYPMTGNWIMVNLGDTIGFVFAGDISIRRPKLTDRFGLRSIDYQKYLGDKIKDTTELAERSINDSFFEIERDIIIYEFGKYETEFFDGCFDHYYTFTNLDFNEVFFIMMSMYGLKVNNETIFPGFSEQINGQIKFWGLELTFEIIMTQTENGWQIYSYDCT